MTTLIKDNGIWKEPEMIYVRDQNIWKAVGGLRVPEIGDPFAGGFVAAINEDSGYLRLTILADKSAEVNATFRSATGAGDPTNTVNGFNNSATMFDSSHLAALVCMQYQSLENGGWFLGARDQMIEVRTNLDPLNPATPIEFREGGVQAFEGSNYWTSTSASNNNAYVAPPSLNPGTQALKTLNMLIRPIRIVSLISE